MLLVSFDSQTDQKNYPSFPGCHVQEKSKQKVEKRISLAHWNLEKESDSTWD